ncbi:MAG TPA: efflux RND transporter periplasmic adaptor subunit [Bacteroidales bacterium]|nr:efflux RND transporter periplasmic adaptor subunit [Bacteroidales bacterium]HSA43901.1 efflux RND transporter periplasmic adaptor subunit [Bacteroidales bacterium]
MKLPRKKIIRLIILLVIVLIIIMAIGRKKGWFGDTDQTRVSIETVSKRDLIESVSANGRIQPETEVKVTPDISGEITELFVKEGDQVKTGDILAKVNPEIYRSNLDQATASLNTQRANEANMKARHSQVQAQFLNAKSGFERSEKLYKQQAISTAEYDNAKATYESARAEVEAAEQSIRAASFTVKSAEAILNEARENFSKTTIYAPVDGTISKLSVEKGERVSGTSQFSPGTEIMRIANLGGMEVNVSVNENDIVRVSLHDTALIEVDAYMNRKFKGIVTEIATSANVSGVSVDQVTNFDVKIRVLRESYLDLLKEDMPGFSPLRPGMSATVDIQTQRAHQVLTVPIQAVTTRVDSALVKAKKDSEERKQQDMNAAEKKETESFREYVFVLEEGIVKMTEVKSGIQDNTYIEIKEGLKEGQEVVTAPYRAISKTLKDGDKVKKVDKKDLFSKE